uniref:Selenoprotein P N-terminal domain-containing protein n=2 Tax=Electrophorus electricus TaxID=8005 RepID=A0AAY5F1R7_ELEEL
MYWELKRRAAEGIPVYQQSPLQADVWEALQGDKDDFLVYDRCGLLTFHIVLPYSYLHYPYVEAAIRATYLKDICNCTMDFNSTLLAEQQNTSSTLTGESLNATVVGSTEGQPAHAEHGGHHHRDRFHQSHDHPSHFTNRGVATESRPTHANHGNDHRHVHSARSTDPVTIPRRRERQLQ